MKYGIDRQDRRLRVTAGKTGVDSLGKLWDNFHESKNTINGLNWMATSWEPHTSGQTKATIAILQELRQFRARQ